MHRDIKTMNVLLNNEGEAEICDFGMAREMRDDAVMQLTPRVGTLWYRAPEIFLSPASYGRPIDIWAAGCVIAEMYLQRPLFQCTIPPGLTRNEQEAAQVQNIFSIVGPPPPDLDWAQSVVLQGAPGNLARYLQGHVPTMSPQAIDLLVRMLSIDPARRPTPNQVLQDKYFYVSAWSDRDQVKKRLRQCLERQPYCCDLASPFDLSGLSAMGSYGGSSRDSLNDGRATKTSTQPTKVGSTRLTLGLTKQDLTKHNKQLQHGASVSGQPLSNSNKLGTVSVSKPQSPVPLMPSKGGGAIVPSSHRLLLPLKKNDKK